LIPNRFYIAVFSLSKILKTLSWFASRLSTLARCRLVESGILFESGLPCSEKGKHAQDIPRRLCAWLPGRTPYPLDGLGMHPAVSPSHCMPVAPEIDFLHAITRWHLPKTLVLLDAPSPETVPSSPACHRISEGAQQQRAVFVQRHRFLHAITRWHFTKSRLLSVPSSAPRENPETRRAPADLSGQNRVCTTYLQRGCGTPNRGRHAITRWHRQMSPLLSLLPRWPRVSPGRRHSPEGASQRCNKHERCMNMLAAIVCGTRSKSTSRCDHPLTAAEGPLPSLPFSPSPRSPLSSPLFGCVLAFRHSPSSAGLAQQPWTERQANARHTCRIPSVIQKPPSPSPRLPARDRLPSSPGPVGACFMRVILAASPAEGWSSSPDLSDAGQGYTAARGR